MVRRMAVLGATGFLGPHLLRAGTAAGFEVHSLSRRPLELPTAAAVRPFGSACDATRPGELERALAAIDPDCILVAAALSRQADCDREPVLARALNVELPRRAARFAAARDVRAVLISTDLVFGAQTPPPTGFREVDPCAPVSSYGETKAAGERAFLEQEPRGLVVRLPLLFGDSFGRGLGASDALLAALDRGERPWVFTDEHRSPLEVSDAAHAVIELADSRATGLLHVGGPERLSRAELGRLILTARGRAAEFEGRVRLGRRADLGLASTRPADCSFDSTRARSILSTPLRAPAYALGIRD